MVNNVLKGKRLLLLGGSSWKEAIKQFAVEHDITLIAAGLWHVGIYDIADESYTVDLMNQDLMKQFIKDKKIDGVYMGGAENIISTACQYINDLGLPCYCTKGQWEYLQNKSNFKQLCIKCGLPIVPQFVINVDNIKDSVPSSAYPVITKPTDGCGSSGFSVCYNEIDLLNGYIKAENESSSKSVICEKFVKNEGVVVFYTFHNGKIVFSGLEDKFPVRFEKHGSYVGGLFCFESKFTTEFRARYEPQIQNLISSIGVKEGTAWIEVFHDGDNYYFNEVGFRYGGSVSIYPVDYFYGINQVAADIYYALTGESMIYGHTSLFPDTFPKKKKYCIYPIYLHSGKIASISGLDNVRLFDNVAFISMTKKVGDNIPDSGSFSQSSAIVHFVCDNEEECRNTISKIHQMIHIKDTKNQEMVFRMLSDEQIEFS